MDTEDIFGKTGFELEIWRLLEGPVELLGFDIADIEVYRSSKGVTLKITIDNPDEAVTIDDCAKVSGMCGDILDANDPIEGPYTLEVSSPGINRNIRRLREFERFKGEKARLETVEKIDGRHRFKGILKGLSENKKGVIICNNEGKDIIIPISILKKARLDRI